MREPVSWSGVAYNQASESENKIHSDEVAKRYGFRGGLVPGVTVYAYLAQPAVAAWGREWMERGAGDIVLAKPLYDGGEFRVAVTPDGPRAYRGTVVDAGGTVCAEGRIGLPDEPPPRLRRRGDRPAPTAAERPPATRAVMERLRDEGMGALRVRWDARGEYDRYTRDLDPMPALLRPDGDGFANPAFVLGLANWVLAGNVCLGPWIHAQSTARNHAAIPPGSALVIEAAVADLFTRGGHEFVDLDVAVFIEPDTPALSARHRAIYKLRGA